MGEPARRRLLAAVETTPPRPHRESDQQQADKDGDGSDKVSVDCTARYGHGRLGTGRVSFVKDCEQSVQTHEHAGGKRQKFSGAAHVARIRWMVKATCGKQPSGRGAELVSRIGFPVLAGVEPHRRTGS
jgi:hypothetical protein